VSPPAIITLADGLARARLLYPPPLPSAPHILVIDVPTMSRGAGLGLGRYYAIIIETDAELEEVERYLMTERAEPLLPNLLDYRPSNVWTDTVLICRYDPPADGWPWLVLAHWPPIYAQAAKVRGIAMARGCYSFDLFEQADAADTHCVELLETLASRHPLEVRLLCAETAAPGTA
jgi:hypothetical protein